MKLTVKIAGLFAVVAFALTASTTSAQTVSELQALIASLQAQISALGSGTTTTTSTTTFTYTRDITLGATGSDVVALQTFLESKGQLVIPAGTSKGYFGALTQAALAKYQMNHGIVPASGYFGPITRAKVMSEGAIATPGTPSTPGTLGKGEASLESFDLSAGDDSDVEEGESAEIAEIEFDVEDGDINLDRIDLKLSNSSSTDPWDVFSSVKLLVDGDEIAEMDLDDEDEYLDEDAGTFRLSGINYVAREGDTVTIVVELTAQNNIDDEDMNDWSLSTILDGIRATDGEGIQQYVGIVDSVLFDVEVAGEGEELNVSSSSDNPDATTLAVEDDAKSDELAIFAFELEAEESDIEIDTVQVEITTSSSTSNMISDLILEIDGEAFDDWSYVSGTSASTTRLVEFDIDGDFTLDADDEVTVVLMAEFKAANGTNYPAGATVSAKINAVAAIQGEGKDDVDSTGSAYGKTHTLEVEGIIVDKSGFKDVKVVSNNDNNTSKDFTFTFEAEAFEEDFYIATSSVTIFVDGGTASSTFTVDSTGDEDEDEVFTVKRGESETFTVVVTVSNVDVAGQYRVGLDSVKYTKVNTGLTSLSTKDVNNSDFRTAYSTVSK